MVTYGGNEKEISDLFIRTGRIQYIVMSFILSAFVVFGRPFIQLWAGEGYEEAYYVSLLFFFSLSIPLIQNLGITILQARNQMHFRSVKAWTIAFEDAWLLHLWYQKMGNDGMCLRYGGRFVARTRLGDEYLL